jgi:hypothetical protein
LSTATGWSKLGAASGRKFVMFDFFNRGKFWID